MREGSGGSATAARPRLLVITPDFPPARGGIQTSTERMVASIERLDPHVVTLDGPGAREHDGAGELRVTRIRAPGPAPLRNAALNAGATAIGLRLRPHVTICSHMVASPAAALLALATGAPTVQWFHAKEIGHRPRLARFAAGRAACVVAVSSYTAGLLEDVGAHADAIVAPGVDPPSVLAREPDAAPTILTVSRLHDRYKGHDVMLRALVRVLEDVPAARWVVIGEGALRGELEASARALGLGAAVIFCGAVEDAERDAWLRRAHVFAMPSRLPENGAGEGFGIVYMEAAAHGLPVLAGAVGGALDAVADGVTGLLVDPSDEVAVARGLVRILSEPALAARLGAAGAERARGYAWTAVAARVEELLLETIAAGPRSRRGRPAPRGR